MKIQVRNSLFNKKTPISDDQLIKAYICGPTVYNSSHLGHARTYITFDVIRRILEKVFHRTVLYQMNVTDIDDKIITRAAEQQVPASEIAQKYESEFFDDLSSLNIQKPTIVTRVTSFIPEIVDFIQQIIKNDFAYVSKNSVYFDTESFKNSGFQYPKLRYSTTLSQKELLENGEGVSAKNRVGEKKNPSDFALWKAAKPGEPSWEAPFGSGRPGWHIECSVMADSVLIRQFGGFHLHFGGKDLQFPHHANEVAQLEAFYKKSDLIETFVHSGHLYIDNEVMSKSKMNFRTIRDVLQQYTANQIRVFFLQVDYQADINYSATSLDYAVNLEQKIKLFLQNTAVLQQEKTIPSLDANDVNVLKQVIELKAKIPELYADDFDYPAVFKLLMLLIDSVKEYISQVKTFKVFVVKQAEELIIEQFGILGLQFTVGNNQQNNEKQFVEVINQLRYQIKQSCLQESAPGKRELREICDNVRDVLLPPLNYCLEDQQDGTSVVKQLNYQDYLVNKQREEALNQEKQQRALLQKQEKEKKLQEEKKLAEIKAEDMFKDTSNEEYKSYVEFDEKGIPTKMKDESDQIVDIPKSKQKKLQKEWDVRKKLNDKYAEK